MNLLVGKYADQLYSKSLHERNDIFRQMVQANCDYWFGKNVHKVKKASYDYDKRELSYELHQPDIELVPKARQTEKPRTRLIGN